MFGYFKLKSRVDEIELAIIRLQAQLAALETNQRSLRGAFNRKVSKTLDEEEQEAERGKSNNPYDSLPPEAKEFLESTIEWQQTKQLNNYGD